MFVPLLNQCLDEHVLRYQMERGYAKTSIKSFGSLMFFNLFNAVSDVRVIPFLLQISAHSQLYIFEGVEQNISRGTYKAFCYVLSKFVVSVFELIDELVERVEHGVFYGSYFESPKGRANAKM